VEKYDGAIEATDENITRRIRFACCISKAIDTHSDRIHNTFLFHSHIGYSIATQFYVIRTLPVLLKFIACLE